jgi:hypothetical protein
MDHYLVDYHCLLLTLAFGGIDSEKDRPMVGSVACSALMRDLRTDLKVPVPFLT